MCILLELDFGGGYGAGGGANFEGFSGGDAQP
jgi:hypothetical protein